MLTPRTPIVILMKLPQTVHVILCPHTDRLPKNIVPRAPNGTTTTSSNISLFGEMLTEMECWCWRDPTHQSGLVLMNHHGTVLLLHSVVYVNHHTTESENHTLVYDHRKMASCQSSEYDHSVMKLRPLGHHYAVIKQSLINVHERCKQRAMWDKRWISQTAKHFKLQQQPNILKLLRQHFTEISIALKAADDPRVVLAWFMWLCDVSN